MSGTPVFGGTRVGDGNYDKTPSIGLLKSTDGGVTWNTTGLTFPIAEDKQIHKVTYHLPTKAVLVASSDGLFRSTDGGKTFTQPTGVDAGAIFDIEVHPTNPKIIYLVGKEFFRSADGGVSFTKVAPPTAAPIKMEIAVSKAKPDFVYLLSLAKTKLDAVYRSTDAGVSFTLVADSTGFKCTQANYNNAMAVNPNNADDLTVGCVDAFRSTDGGHTWSKRGKITHSDIHDLAYASNGDLYAVHDGGISRNTADTLWENVNNNLIVGDTWRIGVFHKDYDLVCSARQDNGVDIHHNMEKGWSRQGGGDGFGCFWNLEGNEFYLSAQSGAIELCDYDIQARAALDKIAWCDRSIRPKTPEGKIMPGIRNSPFSRAYGNNTLYTALEKRMVKSTNKGVTWDSIGYLGGDVLNFVVAPSNNDYIYTMTGASVYATSDGGKNWRDVWTMGGVPFNGAVSLTDPKDVWVAVSGYSATGKVYHSIDGGATWKNETSTGLPNVPANTIVLDYKIPGDIYLGTNAGVYYRSNKFATWQNFAQHLPNAMVTEMEIAQKGDDASDRMLVAGTYGRGVWRTRLWAETSGVEATKKSPGGR